MNLHACRDVRWLAHDPEVSHFILGAPDPTNLVYLSARRPGPFKHLPEFLRLQLAYQEIGRTWQPYNQPCFRPEVTKKTKFSAISGKPSGLQGSINKERNSADCDFKVPGWLD